MPSRSLGVRTGKASRQRYRASSAQTDRGKPLGAMVLSAGEGLA